MGSDGFRAAVHDTDLAVREFDDARRWLAATGGRPTTPLAVEVWVFDPELHQVVLVRHRWRGWVPPGGTVEAGETPREAAARELLEEAGLRVSLLPRPAVAAIRSYRKGWSATLGLSYVAIADRSTPLAGEDGQPAAWKRLDQGWESVFPDDPDRIRWHARWLAQAAAAHGHHNS